MENAPIDRRRHPDWLEIDVWPAADGWPLRSFRCNCAPDVAQKGSLLFQTGRADFLEKYIETFDHLRRRGWAIEGFDWRGQGGSGRLLSDLRSGHGAPYPVMIEDLSGFAQEWRMRTKCPHIAIGHSMGGHLLLRWLAGQRPALDGAVLVAPMLGLNSGLLPEPIGRLIARMLCEFGFAQRAAWKESPADAVRRQRNLTNSPERFADEMWWRESHPELDAGPPSWQWLKESWDSIALLQQAGQLEQIETPILLIYAEQDKLVRAGAIRAAARRLMQARSAGNNDAAHEILRDADPVRLWAWREMDEFLDGCAE